jgi:hypothetical protein
VTDRFLHADVNYQQNETDYEIKELKAKGTEQPRAEDFIIYIADITAELASMARKARLDISAYLLDMSRLETLSALDRIPPSKSEGQEPSD